MLFISSEARGKGVGRRLIQHAINELHINSVDVNEQNNQAVGFYLHMGFEIICRSDKDEQGNP